MPGCNRYRNTDCKQRHDTICFIIYIYYYYYYIYIIYNFLFITIIIAVIIFYYLIFYPGQG